MGFLRPDPILFGATESRPAARYLWLVTYARGERPVLRVHKNYPSETGRLINVHPDGIEMPAFFALACGVSKVDLGWSKDGHHWVLFGLNQYNPLHFQVAKESFPEVLAAIIREATTTPEAQHVLDRMRAAYHRSS